MTYRYRKPILWGWWTLAAAAAWPGMVMAQAPADQLVTWAIPAGDLSPALRQFATQSRMQLIYSSALTDGRKTQGLSGNYAPGEALTRLLKGSGLVAERVNDRTMVLRPGGAQGDDPSRRPSVNGPHAAGPTATAKPAPTDLSVVAVTGTRIRGGVSASPTITLDEQQFREEGLTTLGDVIRRLPQNYRGGQNPGVGAGASVGDQTNHNMTGGSALNLRGLGPGATLTLLNGRRLSYDGPYQGVDISAIPIEAVDRLEIVPDGASAIYGSDAVGGVANVILKPDFDGLTVGSLFGTSSGGGGVRHDDTATAGSTWRDGGWIGTFKTSRQTPIDASQRSYTQALQRPTTLYPGSTLRSGLLSLHQALGDAVEFRVDALHTWRKTQVDTGYAGYRYAGRQTARVTRIAPSVQVNLPHDWQVTASLAQGRDNATSQVRYQNEATSRVLSEVCYCNKTRAWDVAAEGPLFRLNQQDARLAAGVGERRDSYAYRSYLSGAHYGGDQHSRFAYGELSLPVVSTDTARPGLHRLAFNAAVRTEDYNGFGHVTTPRLGVLYDPSRDVTLKLSWGRSFKAPTLDQRYANRIAYLWTAQQTGCATCARDATVLMSYGGNPDLKPERARTWTASLAFHPETLPDLEAELTYFHIDYTQRVVAPIAVTAQALRNPAYAPFVTRAPDAAQLKRVLATYNATFYNYTGTRYDPAKVIAVVAGQNINVARQRAQGVDLSGSYRSRFAQGQLEWRASLSRLQLDQQNQAGQRETELTGSMYYPARFNARAGAVWTRGGIGLSAFVNHTSGVTSDLTAFRQKTASMTTFDATASYETSPGPSLIAGITLALSVDNLFNRRPPGYTPPFAGYLPYDSTNYSAIGRYITVSVNKHW